MDNRIKITTDVDDFGQFPVQIEGTVDGHPFYFRARGSLSICIAENPNDDPVDVTFGEIPGWCIDLSDRYDWPHAQEYKNEPSLLSEYLGRSSMRYFGCMDSDHATEVCIWTLEMWLEDKATWFKVDEKM